MQLPLSVSSVDVHPILSLSLTPLQHLNTHNHPTTTVDKEAHKIFDEAVITVRCVCCAVLCCVVLLWRERGALIALDAPQQP